MKQFFVTTLLCLALSACVQVPEPPVTNSTAPVVNLESSAVRAFPGSSFEIEAQLSDDDTDVEELEVTWSANNTSISVTEEANDSAVFFVDWAATPNQEVEISVEVTDASGNKTTDRVSILIAAEPLAVLVTTNEEVVTSNKDPLYLTGLYSAKQTNLKQDDEGPSANSLVDMSPDGKYIFYTQQYTNLTWQANLYNTQTASKQEVLLDFASATPANIKSYWSDNSNYLAIQVPDSSDSASDILYWLDMSNLISGDLLPESETVSFDVLTWSDSTSITEDSLAALTTDTSIQLFEPAATEVLVLLEEADVVDNEFTAVDASSVQWSDNSLFFIASTEVAPDTEQWNLYQRDPDAEKTVQLNDSNAYDVDDFSVFNKTQVVYQQNRDFYYYNGTTVEEMVVSGYLPDDSPNSNYRWSADGSKLGILKSEPSFTRLDSWSLNNSGVLNVNWTSSEPYKISDWGWNNTNSLITVLSSNDTLRKNTLLEIDTSAIRVDGTTAVKAEDIQQDSSVNNGLPLRAEMERSPTGQWHLFWAVDSLQGSKHLDLWAYNTEDYSVSNISMLGEPYLAPSTVGIFVDGAAYGSNDEDLAWVTNSLKWISDTEVVFEVHNLIGDDEFWDVRVADLSSTAAPHSIILNPALNTSIESLVLAE